MASYDECMESSELRDLLQTALSRPGYGQTAEEILQTCRLVAEAEARIGKKELFFIKNEKEISYQTWKRMIAISKKNLLWKYKSIIPANLSAIYRLCLLDDRALQECFADGLITPHTSSRAIEKLKKRTSIEKSYKTSRHQVYLFVQEELDDRSLRDLLNQINAVANKYNACFDTEDLEEISKDNMQKMFSLRRQLIESAILQEIQILLTDKSINPKGDTQGNSSIYLLKTCIDLTFGEFVKVLKSLSPNRQAMMRDFGKLYCLKLAHEYWRTSSRSQRYNCKRRLLEVHESYPETASHAQLVLDNYVELVDESREDIGSSDDLLDLFP
jgi:hypothetical protein